jgi:hypothetical protein
MQTGQGQSEEWGRERERRKTGEAGWGGVEEEIKDKKTVQTTGARARERERQRASEQETQSACVREKKERQRESDRDGWRERERKREVLRVPERTLSV